MRILNVTGGVSANAGEQTITRLKHYFPDHDITCGILDSPDPSFEQLAADRGIDTEYFGPAVTDRFESLSLLPSTGYSNATKYAVKNDSFDLVHVYGGPLFHGPVGVLNALASQAPLVTRFNGYIPKPDSTVKRLIVSSILSAVSRSDRVVFNSKGQQRDTLSQYDIGGGDNIETIPPGVEAKNFYPVDNTTHRRRDLGIDERTAVVGSVMTPRPVKRIDRAFEIVDRLSDRLDIRYVVLGSSEYLEEYKRQAAAMGVDEITHWVGHVSQDDLPGWYSLFDATILTSEWESFGMSLTESYLCETPCVAFDVGGMRDQILDGETGHLIHPYDLEQFTRRLEVLLSNPSQAASFGQTGKEYVSDRFTLTAAGTQYEQMIESIT